MDDTNELKTLGKVIERLVIAVIGLVLLLCFSVYCNIAQPNFSNWFVRPTVDTASSNVAARALEADRRQQATTATYWAAPDTTALGDDEKSDQIRYGKDLIANTSKYLGPRGSVSKISNGMNCQNCHLEAGTKVWGNNYGAVFATYPKYRARSGEIEGIYRRVNDCMQRSLNGRALDTLGTEMQAIKAYIEWLGRGVKKGEKAKGAGITDLPFMEQAADPALGQKVYTAQCQSCHQSDGQGVLAANKIAYTYPPLWGKNSYNTGAGLFRLSRFAGYVKYNMPLGATYQNPILTDDEAWNVAAFVNAQSRPTKDLTSDWPKLAEKPVDHPFGPFADTFSEMQHKFGPFGPISAEKERQKKLKLK